MPRKKKFLAVTPVDDIPWEIRSGVTLAFGGTRVRCQMCSAECLLDAGIDADEWDIFYCIDCSARAGLTIREVVDQLVNGLSISYQRYVMLAEILKAEPGTRRHTALITTLRNSGVNIADYTEREN